MDGWMDGWMDSGRMGGWGEGRIMKNANCKMKICLLVVGRDRCLSHISIKSVVSHFIVGTGGIPVARKVFVSNI